MRRNERGECMGISLMRREKREEKDLADTTSPPREISLDVDSVAEV
jgi:hypothetical protein